MKSQEKLTADLSQLVKLTKSLKLMAKDGAYEDSLSTYATPKVKLVSDLNAVKNLVDVIHENVMKGTYDG